jgi:hypothetical protein
VIADRHVYVTAELTEEEAEVLAALIGGIPKPSDNATGEVLRGIFHALDMAVPNRTKSYGDLFQGEVIIK